MTAKCLLTYVTSLLNFWNAIYKKLLVEASSCNDNDIQNDIRHQINDDKTICNVSSHVLIDPQDILKHEPEAF